MRDMSLHLPILLQDAKYQWSSQEYVRTSTLEDTKK